MRFLIGALLLVAPPLLIYLYIWKQGSLTRLKTISLAAMFIGAALAYLHYGETGVFGLVLAVAGFIGYVDEVKQDGFREMRRLAYEEEPPTRQEQPPA